MPHRMLPDTGQPYPDIAKLQLGEVSSFHELYLFYHEEFVGKAVAMLDDKEEAGNLVSHCFIKCWLKSDAMTSRDYILAFLNTTMRNCCREWNNREENSVHQKVILKSVQFYPEDHGLTRKELSDRISRLKPKELAKIKPAFSRFYERQMPVREIAEELNVLPGNVQQRLELAYQVLHLILYRENI